MDSNRLLYIAILTADHKYKTAVDYNNNNFEWDSYFSMLSLLGVVEKQWNIPKQNIILLSPKLFHVALGTLRVDGDKIKNKFESIKWEHHKEPYTAVFLHIVGHSPKCDDGGSYQFDIGNDHFVSLNEIKSLLEKLASCSKIIVVKDFCNAEAYDLLPNVPIKPEQVRVQWSSCDQDGEAYNSVLAPSNSVFHLSRLFSSCLANGHGHYCPNDISHCKVCKNYRNSIMQRNGVISYNLLQDEWVKPHMLQCDWMRDCDIPVLHVYTG